MARTRIEHDQTVLGKARYATLAEIQQAGLMQSKGGIVLGHISNNLLELPPDQHGHVLIVGGTGTGKSRGIAIPTLLRWQGSILAIDVKGELSEKTAEYRKGKVRIFDPESENGHPYDPLKGCTDIATAQELARSLIPEPKKGDPFWSKTAQAFLAAGAYEGAMEGRTFSQVIEKLCTTPAEALIEDFQSSPHRAVKMLSSVGVGMPEKTMGGVFAELKSKLITLGADPNIERATAYSSWSPEILEEESTVYLRVSEKMLKQYEGLWTVIVSQIFRYLSGRQERAAQPVLILLDEFARLGKIEGILEALATLRSKNVHIAIVIQSMAQLDHIYSPAERKIIADNCTYKLILSATDPETQDYFSKLSGQRTVWVGNQGVNTGRSSAGSIIGSASKGESSGVSQQATPLIQPAEFAKLPHPVLFTPNMYPISLGKAYWDKMPDTAALVGLKVEAAKSNIKKLNKPQRSKFANTMLMLLITFALSIALGYFETKFIYDIVTKNTDTTTLSAVDTVTMQRAEESLSSIGMFIKNTFSTMGGLQTYVSIALIPSVFIVLIVNAIFRRFRK